MRGPAEEVSPVAPGEAEANGPVDDGPQTGVQPVLNEDVDGVLRPHRSGLQESEAALHEEDDDSENCQEEMVNIGLLVINVVILLSSIVDIRIIGRLQRG